MLEACTAAHWLALKYYIQGNLNLSVRMTFMAMANKLPHALLFVTPACPALVVICSSMIQGLCMTHTVVALYQYYAVRTVEITSLALHG